MIGAIIGDIAGAPYEGGKLGQDKRDYRPFFLNGLAKFTDDTNLTVAVGDAILHDVPVRDKLLEWHNRNPNLGYGSAFREWAENGGVKQNESRGNGAAMRVSSIPLLAFRIGHFENGVWVPDSFEERTQWALIQAVKSTEPTHNCDESRNGAMAVVAATMMAGVRTANGERVFDKEDIRREISKLAGYDLTADIETVREKWEKRDIRCDITVPQALICFLESTDFEDAVRLGVYTKGDTDTIAAIAGGIAEWYYGLNTINPGILAETKLRLSPEMIAIVDECYDGSLKW